MIDKVTYAGRPNNYAVSDGTIEAVLTADVGPRVIRFGLVDGPNEFAELPDVVTQTAYGPWRIYGGHRLWHAPEAMPRSYYPDNEPLAVELGDDHVEVTRAAEPATGISKVMRLTLGDGFLDVEHILTNEGLWPVELAPWALSVMTPGGIAIVPLAVSRDPDNLLPNRSLTLWPYADPADARLRLGRHLITVRQDPAATLPFKVGTNNDLGWAAYLNHGNLFVKRFSVDLLAAYPDNGSTVECYTNAAMLELESLGPLVLLEPGEATYYVERWYLFPGLTLPLDDEDTLLEDLIGRLEHTSEPD